MGFLRGGAGVESSTVGMLPVLRIDLLNVTLAILCLVIAAVIFVEPLLPTKLRKGAKAVRCSAPWQAIRGFHLFVAFILGALAGIDFLVENLPTFSWLINAVAYASIVIILGIPLKIVVDVWSAMTQQSGNDHG